MNVHQAFQQLITSYHEKAAAVEVAEEVLKEAKAALADIECDMLPSLMDSLNITRYNGDGVNIQVKSDFSLSWKTGDETAATKWLIVHGHSNLLESTVSIGFVKEKHANAVQLQKRLLDMGYSSSLDSTINTSSLKAALRKDLKQGVDVPFNIFGASPWRRAILKTKKESQDQCQRKPKISQKRMLKPLQPLKKKKGLYWLRAHTRPRPFRRESI